MTFFLDGIDSYSSVKSSSTATPSLLFGKSRMCPIDATTLYFRPRYLLMVFAFAGDSTTTSAFAISALYVTPVSDGTPDTAARHALNASLKPRSRPRRPPTPHPHAGALAPLGPPR